MKRQINVSSLSEETQAKIKKELSRVLWEDGMKVSFRVPGSSVQHEGELAIKGSTVYLLQNLMNPDRSKGKNGYKYSMHLGDNDYNLDLEAGKLGVYGLRPVKGAHHTANKTAPIHWYKDKGEALHWWNDLLSLKEQKALCAKYPEVMLSHRWYSIPDSKIQEIYDLEHKSQKELASQEQVTLRFDGYDQPKELTDYLAQGYPELRKHGEFWEKKAGVKISVPNIITFMEWLQKAPSYRSIEAIHGRDGTNDVLVKTHLR